MNALRIVKRRARRMPKPPTVSPRRLREALETMPYRDVVMMYVNAYGCKKGFKVDV